MFQLFLNWFFNSFFFFLFFFFSLGWLFCFFFFLQIHISKLQARICRSWFLGVWLRFGFTFKQFIYCSGVCQMFSSVQFSHSVVSDSLRPHEPQHARPPCPSPTPGVHPNPCPLSQWCHTTISSSVVTFSSCPQSFPASVSFPMSHLFASGGQSIGVSASTSVLPMNTQYSSGESPWTEEPGGLQSMRS